MAKRPKKNQPIVITGEEKMETVDIVKITEAWSQYTLSDGTVLKVKPAVIQIKRVIGTYNPDGKPVYAVQAGVALDTDVPKKLLKKKRK